VFPGWATLAVMNPRGVTVLLGAVITAVLSLGIVNAPVPYVVLVPGPTVNTLGEQDGKEVIEVDGTSTSTSKGQLRLTTVGVVKKVDLIRAIRGWFDNEEAVVPRELYYPPGETDQQSEQRNAQEFQQSQTSAETAALREMGYPVQVVVTKLVPGGPAEGTLRTGDVITTVDGEPATTAERLTELIRAHPAGTALTIGYTRAGKPASTVITTAGDPPRIGVEIDQRQPHPFQVKIDLEDIGGPSAGLMFTLGIIDKLRPEDLTGGKLIAGTGTIDDEGRVGPIGGIAQKLVAAREVGASVFLVPKDNCAEALANAQPGLTMAKVGTLDGALDALSAVRSGRAPTPCTAG
jgi:PDZ domain-containing protein